MQALRMHQAVFPGRKMQVCCFCHQYRQMHASRHLRQSLIALLRHTVALLQASRHS